MPRTFIVPMFFILSLLTTARPAWAQGFDPSADRQPPSISVTGSAVTRVAPDFAEWNITLGATDKDPAAAKAKIDDWVQKLFEVRDDLNVEKADFETGPASVKKDYEYVDRGGTRESVFQGYEITRKVVVRQRELDKFDDFLTAFAKEGHTFEMRLRSSQEDKVWRETRIEAVKAAKQKAEELAAAMDVRVIMPLYVDATDELSIPIEFYSNKRSSFEAVDLMDSDSYTPGMLDIRVTVQATFELGLLQAKFD